MHKRKISDYIFFGTALRYLLQVDERRPVNGWGNVAYNVDNILSKAGELGLPVTEKLASMLGLDDLQADLAQVTEADATLTDVQVAKLKHIMPGIRNTAVAEAGLVYAYVLASKRFDVETLVSDVQTLFAPGAFKSLPEQAQEDFAEAGRCIAFERPTAAAFHLMRGLEAALRDYYSATVKQKRVKPLLWAAMVEHLRKRSKPPPAALLDNLDSIRVNYRNPTQHPDATYDIHEVQDLFGLCLDVANRLARAHPAKG